MQPPKFRAENRGTRRKPNYRAVYWVDGTRYREPTGARTLADYEAYVQGLARKFLLGTWTPPGERGEDGLTFEKWVPQAMAKRVANGVKTGDSDEESIARLHLVPEFGPLLLTEISFVRTVEGFARIRERVRSGSTVGNIHVVFAAYMRLAAKAGHIANAPRLLSVRDGELPPVVCMKPEGWRQESKFAREEIAALLNCDEVELQYRVMYVAWFLTGSRFIEIVPLRWRNWDRDRMPLGSLTIKAVKTKRSKGQLYRLVPTHPTLAAWLTWWHREGYELVHGRRPEPDALIFPSCSLRRRNAARRAGLEGDVMCSHGEVYKRWQRHHLPAANLRHRRLHDARGTFISITRSSVTEAQDALIRSITHKGVTDKVLDEGYTVWQWTRVCEVLSSVDWRLPGPPSSNAVVVPLRARNRAKH